MGRVILGKDEDRPVDLVVTNIIILQQGKIGAVVPSSEDELQAGLAYEAGGCPHLIGPFDLDLFLQFRQVGIVLLCIEAIGGVQPEPLFPHMRSICH